MPRIYAPVQDSTVDWPAVPFIEGVAAVPQGSATAHFTTDGYAVDNSKHALSVYDRLTKTQIREILDYQGISYIAGDSKQVLLRKIETAASTAKLVALTLTSVAGTALGDSLVTVTVGAIGTAGNTKAFKTGPDPVAVLYRDVPGTDYTAFVSGTDITPDTVGDDTIMVVELNAAGEVLAYGTHALTVKTA